MNKTTSHISFFLPYYPKNTTGGNKYSAQVYNILKEEDEDVSFFGGEPNFMNVEKSKFRKIIYGLKIALRLPGKSIIILTNTAFLHFLFPLLVLNLFKRHKYIIIIHHLLRDEKCKWSVHLLEGIFIKLINNKITVSKTTKRSLLVHKLIKSDIPIIEPGLDYVANDNYIRHKINKVPQLLFVGNVERRKSLAVVIRALKLLKGFDFCFNIAGNISDKDYFKELEDLVISLNLNDNVNFLGKITSDELSQYYRNSDIFIFPSHCEGYGMVICEAMANGLPVISSDIPASKELIKDGFNGLLFKTEDCNDLSDCIMKLVSDSNLYAEISQNSVNYALSLNTWKTSANKILNYLKNYNGNIDNK